MSADQALIHVLQVAQAQDLAGLLLPLGGALRLLSRGGQAPVSVIAVTELLPELDPDVLALLFVQLATCGLLRRVPAEASVLYTITNESVLQWALESASTVLKLPPEVLLHRRQDTLYWTPPGGFPEVSASGIRGLKRLDMLIDELSLQVRSRIVIFGPYFSVAGVERLAANLAAVVRRHPHVAVDAIANDLDQNDQQNWKALRHLRDRVRDATPKADFHCWVPAQMGGGGLRLHAKFLLADNIKGVLGSANFSKAGMEAQMELAVQLNGAQVKTLTALVDRLIDTHYLQDATPFL